MVVMRNKVLAIPGIEYRKGPRSGARVVPPDYRVIHESTMTAYRSALARVLELATPSERSRYPDEEAWRLASNEARLDLLRLEDAVRLSESNITGKRLGRSRGLFG
jgi:hypothetical protein